MLAKDKQKLRHFLSLYLRYNELKDTDNRNEKQEERFIVLYALLVKLTSVKFMESK